MPNAGNKNIITGMLLFSVFGLMVETIFTGFAAAWVGSFKGGVSLLMIPVYSFSYLLAISFIPKLKSTIIFKWYFRLPLIVVLVYIIEWAFGAFYQSLGLRPWYYDHGWASEFSNGNITLLFAPAWLIFALIVIPMVQTIQKSSFVINKNIREEFFIK